MAKETALAPLFIGSDHQYVVHVMDDDEDTAIDITGFALSFMVKKNKADADASALIAKTTASGIAIAGAFNSSPASNLQRATVTIAKADNVSLAPGVRYWELKRTDSGFNTPIAFGTLPLERGVHKS